jgi:hypothetical protein
MSGVAPADGGVVASSAEVLNMAADGGVLACLVVSSFIFDSLGFRKSTGQRGLAELIHTFVKHVVTVSSTNADSPLTRLFYS